MASTQEGSLRDNTLTVHDVFPYAQAIYDRSCVGCCVHIVLDDQNVRESDVEFCCEYALENGHADCLAVALALRRMSKTQRLKLGGMVRR